MRLTIKELPVGSSTTNEKLLDELSELSMKLDSESDELLAAFSADNSSEANEECSCVRRHFGVVYAKDLDKDKTVGYLKYTPTNDVYRIDELYVEKEYRRNCIGFCLMRTFDDLCRRCKVAKINLGCIATNKSAIAFYKDRGYRISDATYILKHSSGKSEHRKFEVKEKTFSINEFERVWNEMKSFLNKEINLDNEVERLREYYIENRNLEPLAICSIGQYEFVVFKSQKDLELYVIASSVPLEELTKDFLDEVASAFLRYAKLKKMKQVVVADVHFPFNLGKTSDCWEEVGYTFFKMASDLQKKASNLKC